MDIEPPFREEPKPAPGEKYAELAHAVASFSHYIGGPKLNEDAVAILIADVFAWLKSS